MTYEDILRIDQYNKAARRGKEMVIAAKSGYAEAARDQARAEMFKGGGRKLGAEGCVPVRGSDRRG